ncbi:MAG: polysaccharide pyruvyl transferase CsaB [Eubacteriales bacterium]|nr:polysaccharide pyruvyl transferase CsaB [Eubacteriales bacterium]
MKILMVLMGLEIGGAETHVVELSKELARRGNEIVVASNGGVYTAELEEAGIRHVCLPLNSRNLKKMYKSYRGLYKVIKNGNFDLVHAHARIPAFICALLKKRLKFRFITTTHWVFKTGPILNLMTNWGERSIAVSEDIKTYLIEKYNIHPNHITVTINGIDTVKFSPETTPGDIIDEFGFEKDKLRAVYVSRMDTDRSAAAFNLINVTGSLVQKYPNFELVVVGDGNDFERLLEHAKKCNESLGRDVVKVVGGRTDINRFVALADVFIGVSRAALEAMAAAKPVIIAGNEGYIGLFDESKLKVAVDTNFCCRGCAMTTDELILADMQKALGMTKEERQKMGEYNRGLILDRYSGKRMADDCMMAYEGLLSMDLKRPNDILISGYYGYKNMGDDSLLQAIIGNLRAVEPKIDICVLSRRPKETAAVYGVCSIHRFNLLKILFSMRKTKLLISGGGSLLQDVTSTKSLMYYLSIIKLAKKLGMKTMIYASGIGPINGKRNRELTGRVLNQVDLITLREPTSYDEIKALGVCKPSVEVTADPAFSIEKEDGEKIDAILSEIGIAKDEKFALISVRPWKGAHPQFSEKMADVCDYIREKHEATPVFLPMQKSVDMAACMDIANKMKCDYKIINSEYTASELIGVIQRSSLVVAMRLHTLIYAASAGVAIFGLSYDPKVDAMLSYIGQGYKADVGNISADKIKSDIDEIFKNEKQLKTALNEKIACMKDMTKKDAKSAVELIFPSENIL